MRPPFVLLVALRFLREGGMQTVLILAGVGVGVAVIVFITALVDQLQGNIIKRTLGSQSHIVVRMPDDANRPALRADSAVGRIVEPRAQRLRGVDQWQSVERLLATSAGVKAVSPLASGPAFAQRGEAIKSVAIMGIEPDLYRRIVALDEHILRGRYQVSGNDALIGMDLAQDLGLAVGDKFRLASAEGAEQTMTVTGIFDIGVRDLNRRWVFTTLRLAQSLLELPGEVTQLDLKVEELFGAEAIAQRISAATGLKAESWMATNTQLVSGLRNQSATSSLIRVFVTLIVAVGIASVLVVSVVQKTRQIGILRAMGARRQQIRSIFLLQGGLVGLVGALLGVILASALVLVFSQLYRNADGTYLIDPQLPPALLGGAAAVAFITGLVAAWLPARRAANMDPVAAIRHD